MSEAHSQLSNDYKAFEESRLEPRKRKFAEASALVTKASKTIDKEDSTRFTIAKLTSDLAKWTNDYDKLFNCSTSFASDALLSGGYIVSTSQESCGSKWLDEWIAAHKDAVEISSITVPVLISFRMGGYKFRDVVKQRLEEDIDAYRCDFFESQFEKLDETKDDKAWNWFDDNFNFQQLEHWAKTVEITDPHKYANYEDIADGFVPQGTRNLPFHYRLIRLKIKE